jgi:hypothetical protein
MLAAILDKLTWLWFKFKWLFVVFMPFVALIGFIEQGVELLTGGLEDLTLRVHDIRVMATANLSPVTPYIGYANAFFPLTEVFAMAALWAGVKITIVFIRLVKGALPTYG